MIDLAAKPFYLKPEDIEWVNTTLAGMTTEEKAGQLFCVLFKECKPEEFEYAVEAGVLSAVLLAVVEPPQAAREPAIRTAMAALIMRLFFILIFFLQSLGHFLVCPFRCLYHTHFSTI